MNRPWLKHYDPGVPDTISYPDTTIDQILAEGTPASVATLFQGDRLTYAELNDLVDRVAAALQHLGVTKGDRVAIHLPNCPPFVAGYFAILRIGAIVVPCNPAYVARELEHQLWDSGAEVVITLRASYKTVRQVRDRTPIRHVIVSTLTGKGRDGDEDLLHEGGVTWFEDMLNAGPGKPSSPDRDVEDTAVLIYTGGTTGISKGAQLTHRNLVANAAQFAHWVGTTRNPPITLAALPLFHSYAMTVCMNHTVYSGGTSILVPDPRNVKDVLETIQRYHPTIYPGVPATYVAINNSPQVAAGGYDLRSIQVCISGGASLPGEVQEKFVRLTGARLVEGYGLSEASPVTHVNPIYTGNCPGSIGLPLPDTDARIVDLETGTREMPPGEIGELCVKGPQVMKGYWDNPVETANVLRDGWLYTGDMATMDEEGYFRIVDRKKDMILGTSGLNVYPREIEEVLYQHPKVKEAAAAGVPERDRGERVKVWIVLQEGETATEEEILAFCRENLAPYKRPKSVEFRDALPKSTVGKVLRRTLLQQEAQARRE